MYFPKSSSYILYAILFLMYSCNQEIEKTPSRINTEDRSLTIEENREHSDFSNKSFEFVEDKKPKVHENHMTYASLEIPAAKNSELSEINKFNVDPKREILDKRDRTAKHYLRKDGNTIDAVLSPKSLHYKKDGQWENINTSILPINEKNYAYTNQANNLKTWFPHDLGKTGVKIATEEGVLIMGQNLNMGWAGKKGKIFRSKNFSSSNIKVDENKILYKEVLNNIHNEYLIESDEIKHNIILEEKPAIPENSEYLIFSEDLTLPDNWKLEFDNNLQGLVILKENKEVYLEIPFPNIYEKNNSEERTDKLNSGFDIIRLTNNKFQIHTKISKTWIENRSFPVVVDPTLILNGATSGFARYKYTSQYIDRSPACGYDYYDSSREYYAYNNTPARIIAYPRSTYSQESYDCTYGWRGTRYYKTTTSTVSNYYRGWIKYNTSTIPDTGEIQSVEFSGNIYSGSTENFNTTIYSSAVPGPYSNGEQAYWSIASHYLGTTTYSDPAQYPYVILNSNSRTYLQNNLAADYFQIGLYYNSNTEIQKSKYFDTNNSLLRVTYTDGCQPPVAISKDFTAYLNAEGSVSISTDNIDDGSTAPCGLESITLSQETFNCENIGENTVTLTISDVNGNSDSQVAMVTIEDHVDPEAITQDITVQLDASGAATIVPADINNGSNDACGIQSLSLDVNSFDCSNIGANPVILTVTDNNNNVSTASATVTVEDNVDPVAIAQDITVQLDASGAASIIPGDIDNGSNDACGIESLALDVTSFDCSNVGPNTVTLTVTDNNQNVSTTTATVTVEDNVDPVAIAKDITVQLDASGVATIVPADIDNGSNDACGIESLALNVTSFDCSNVGPNTVTLTVTDYNQNISTATATVTVEDKVDPVAVAQDITVQLDASGVATIVPADIDNGSNDACGIESLALNVTSFDCSNIGANPVVLTVTDNNQNVSTATATVTVEDKVDPVAIAQDITVQLNASGAATIVPADIDNGSNDACGIQSLALDVTSFDCSNVGPNTVTLTVTDNNQNVSTATATVTVEDKVDPVAIAQDITVQLDASGAASIVPADIDNGSNDACGIQSLSLDVNSFDCSNIGPNSVTLTVTDNNQNISTATATVTVEDNIDPVAIAKDITVQLDASGAASIVPADIDNGSNDACGIESLALDVTSFDCSNIGANTVVLTVTDNNQNVSTATATVTVEDNFVPVAIAQDITIQLDASGAATIVPADIDNGSNDACGIQSLSLDVNSFDCSNIGANPVILTVTDNSNNVSTASATVTVEDNVDPVAIAQDITVQLDASGAASIIPGDIDNGSNDACGIESLALDVTSFDCSNVGPNTVTLTVTDNNQNVSTATATVTVEDKVDPVAIAQDITVQLDASGAASIVPADIDNGSNDACGIQSLSLDVNSFDCSNIGPNSVTLTVTDNNQNISTATATVTVEDNIDPVAIAKDITVQLDASGAASIVPADIDNGSNDACGIESLALDVTSFDCSNIGANTVVLTVTDNNQNVSTATATVTVEDNFVPVAIAQDITIQLDASGAATIVPADIDNGSNDACGIQSLSLDVNSFDCSNIGANPVILTVTDNNNNVSTASATVTVEDNVDPVAIAQDITVQLDASGAASIIPGDIDNGSNDACGIESLALDVTSFDCSNVGPNTVTLTVTDNNQNVSTTTATVTVEDNVDPVAIAQDITVQLDASGAATIVPTDIDNGSNDACGIESLALDVTSFDCSNVGPNTVTMTVTDNNKNVSTATATVTVEDNIDPVAIAQSITIDLDANGYASLTSNDINNGSSDNCSIKEMSLSKYEFGCSDVGNNPVTLTVKDPSGNTNSEIVTVTVNKFKPVTTLSVDPTTQQYSDQVTFTAIIENGYCDTAQQAATEVKFFIGDELMGTTTLSVSGNDLVATLTTELLEKTTGSMSPGVKEINAVFENINSSYELDSPTSEITITQEDAIVEYTGQSLQATRGANDSETTVILTASIQDIAISSITDKFEGDIRNAKVKFVNRDTGADISGWLPVNLLDASDSSTGSASFSWTVDIGNFDSESFTIGVVVDNGYYLRNSSEDNTVITVYKPAGDFITGGGSIHPTNSSGFYSSTEGLKTNFGFNVKYNKKGNKLKGHINVVFRRLESDGEIHTYQIKGNAMQSLGVNVDDRDNQTATFITKSNLTDITDPNMPVSLGGNLYLKVEMTDRGEPGTEDSIAITLTESDGTLLYSSEWNGLSTDEMTLSNGNLMVKSGFSLENADNLETTDATLNTMDSETLAIDLIVSPNPTTDYFTAQIDSKNKKDRVELFVYSYAGSLIYSDKGKPTDKFSFGSRFETGTYIVKIFQAGKTAEKVVIKK